ncbi:polysaccharide deacetylase family protein [Allochromatium palmeri]|uniref:polysaccharide deacetylase family protein n=1 Tax=Allochromatium palmeri TaxID=231048 RepID=UPI001FED172A|nr:polysaccharide deacetylase family protein [Allochromatium palmeri]
MSILIFHRVLAEPDLLQTDLIYAQKFADIIDLFRKIFDILPLSEAIERLRSGTLPARAGCITFDDGYADNLTVATPILKHYGLPATVFVATDYLNGGRMFNDTIIEAARRAPLGRYELSQLGLGLADQELMDLSSRVALIKHILPKVKYLSVTARAQAVDAIVARLKVDIADLPRDLMLTTEMLQALHQAGVEIGAHTRRHPILAGLSDYEAEQEIAEGKHWLEECLKTEIRVFAYPNGKPGVDYSPRDADLAKKLGFIGAVSTAWGAASRKTDPYQLPRFSPWTHNSWGFTMQLSRNLMHQ